MLAITLTPSPSGILFFQRIDSSFIEGTGGAGAAWGEGVIIFLICLNRTASAPYSAGLAWIPRRCCLPCVTYGASALKLLLVCFSFCRYFGLSGLSVCLPVCLHAYLPLSVFLSFRPLTSFGMSLMVTVIYIFVSLLFILPHFPCSS